MAGPGAGAGVHDGTVTEGDVGRRAAGTIGLVVGEVAAVVERGLVLEDDVVHPPHVFGFRMRLVRAVHPQTGAVEGRARHGAPVLPQPDHRAAVHRAVGDHSAVLPHAGRIVAAALDVQIDAAAQFHIIYQAPAPADRGALDDAAGHQCRGPGVVEVDPAGRFDVDVVDLDAAERDLCALPPDREPADRGAAARHRDRGVGGVSADEEIADHSLAAEGDQTAAGTDDDVLQRPGACAADYPQVRIVFDIPVIGDGRAGQIVDGGPRSRGVVVVGVLGSHFASPFCSLSNC